MAPSLTLAVVHGVVAQIFFCVLAAWSAFNSRAWQNPAPLVARTVRTDWALQTVLLALLMVQVVAGAILRHTTHLLHLHITLAALASLAGIAAGVRVWGLYARVPLLARPEREWPGGRWRNRTGAERLIAAERFLGRAGCRR
jgi:hypothetical protein